MAIYHLSVGFVSRSSGRSSVQSAAYITGSVLHETRRDLKVSYQNRGHDVAFTATVAPDHAPDRFGDVGAWDIFEQFEDTYAKQRYKTPETQEAYMNSAQTAMTIVMALPRELSMDISQELVDQFVRERFVSRGLVVTYALHDDEGNPHAHVQVSRRAIDESGSICWIKDRAICTRSALIETRKLWADLTNQYLQREGFEARITEKSFADLGIELMPTQHRGWYSDKVYAQTGKASRVVTENKTIGNINSESIVEHPPIILEVLTKTQVILQAFNGHCEDNR